MARRPAHERKAERMLDILQDTPPREAMAILGYLMSAVLDTYDTDERGEVMSEWLATLSKVLSSHTHT